MRPRSVSLSCALVILFALGILHATTWYVDDDCTGPNYDGSPGDPFCMIQDGLNSAASGDTVLVRDGEYYENVTYSGVDDGILLTSQNGATVTSIIGDGTDAVVLFAFTSHTSATVIHSFTLTGGGGSFWGGGSGLFIASASPEISNFRAPDMDCRA